MAGPPEATAHRGRRAAASPAPSPPRRRRAAWPGPRGFITTCTAHSEALMVSGAGCDDDVPGRGRGEVGEEEGHRGHGEARLEVNEPGHRGRAADVEHRRHDEADLGSGRILASEMEVPIMLGNL